MSGKARYNRCRHKVRFNDRVDAEIALLKALTSKSPRRKEVRAYECRWCFGWHLTKEDKR